MRKKSHICLGRYIADSFSSPESQDHRLAFVVGNVLPDCKPSFLYRRHDFSGTLSLFERSVRSLADSRTSMMDSTMYWTRLGEALHLCADYFTYPHNKIFRGGFNEHNAYEEDLKNCFREYVRSGKAAGEAGADIHFHSAEEIVDYVRLRHGQYLLEPAFTVQTDSRYIAEVCRQVAQGICALYQESRIVCIPAALSGV